MYLRGLANQLEQVFSRHVVPGDSLGCGGTEGLRGMALACEGDGGGGDDDSTGSGGMGNPQVVCTDSATSASTVVRGEIASCLISMSDILPPYRVEVERHEGVTRMSNSHWGRYTAMLASSGLSGDYEQAHYTHPELTLQQYLANRWTSVRSAQATADAPWEIADPAAALATVTAGHGCNRFDYNSSDQ